ISFTSTSSDPDGHVASQAWDLDGDGSFDDGTATSAGYSFATAGPHTVRLRVVDDRGLATIASRTIAVGARTLPPVTPPPPGGDEVSGGGAPDSADRPAVG